MTTDAPISRAGREAPLPPTTEPPRTFGFAAQAVCWTDLGIGMRDALGVHLTRWTPASLFSFLVTGAATGVGWSSVGGDD
ncbi:hypothetical protein [Nocardia rhizosphaerihabitans]|uniref:Uncharacterized protein n=1 Tax=Nocardia rhizosphaerihabitans TaxID=1691570 RepID=A0ABQ2KT77_9NOCA|nr:hypothetical protein [Nocardia rhizosphaerihabitans]GGN90800.1 hypothetical protein GCM10011610_50290 [Nocardia rhizosphaerihabitans]